MKVAILLAIASMTFLATTLIEADTADAQERRVRLGSVSPRLSFTTRRVLANPGKFSAGQRGLAFRERDRADRNQRLIVDNLRR
jgi:hypothetical protein